MANFIQELICKGPIEQVNTLKQQVKKLEDELEKKQEHINKTNAFYKKKMREMSNQARASKAL